VREPTPRQLEIMKLAARGMSHGEVAQHLGISYQTVKNTLGWGGACGYGLYERIGARSGTHALAILIRRGYIGIDELDEGAKVDGAE
jgi:DNA-binding NarL/FixJ family response regulator